MKKIAFVLLPLVVLTACATPDAAVSGRLYRCEHDVTFRVRFEGDMAILDSPGGRDLLEREAPPADGVPARRYRNPRMNVEFGHGGTGREAVLRYPLLPLVVRCVRD